MNKVAVALLLLLIALVSVAKANDADEFKCASPSQVYPTQKPALTQAVIDLDLPPEQRWESMARQYSAEIKSLLDIVKLTFGKFAPLIYATIDRDFDRVWREIPEPYRGEIEGVARGAGISKGEATLYSTFYALFTACTSIVAENPESGEIMHARNLDFGLWPLYNRTDDDWTMTELLKPLLIDISYQRNSTELYRGAGFVGFVGLLTAWRPGAFTVTIDDLFDLDFDSGFRHWIENPNDGAKFVTLFLRDLFESTDNYDSALEQLQTQQLVSPVYFIIGGAQPGEGAVVSREKNATLNLRTLKDARAIQDGHFVLETNYPNYPNQNGTIPPPPFYDRRRTAANHCMAQTEPSQRSWASLFAVIDETPVLNQLTVYSVLMSAQQSNLHWQVVEQSCQDCAFW